MFFSTDAMPSQWDEQIRFTVHRQQERTEIVLGDLAKIGALLPPSSST